MALGHSMGGMVLQTAALRAPERFDALVLMDTSHRALRGVDPGVIELGMALARDEGMAAVLAAQSAFAGPGAPADERVVRHVSGLRRVQRPQAADLGAGDVRACSGSSPIPTGATSIYKTGAEDASPNERAPSGAGHEVAVLAIAGQRHELGSHPIVLGRSKDCDIRLSDPERRRHAEVRPTTTRSSTSTRPTGSTSTSRSRSSAPAPTAPPSRSDRPRLSLLRNRGLVLAWVQVETALPGPH